MPFASLPSDYARILNDLNRDVLRARPLDPLQFCANWFNNRLEAERKAGFLSQQQQHQQQQMGIPGSVTAAASAASAGSAAGSSGIGSSVSFDDSPPSPSLSDAFIPPASYNLGRRTSVSAESLAPSLSNPGASGGADDDADATTKTVIPKSDSQMQRIRSSISNNLLFRNLEDDQYTDVLLAMKEVKVEADHPVIVQGDQGDYFYIVENGQLDVYISKEARDATFSSIDGESTSSNLDRSQMGEKKLSYGAGDSFGELALLYAQPRAATIISTSPCTLWALDRVTFRSILMETNFRRRSMYESLLKDVSLFESLSPAEIAKISDALEPRVYEAGDYVFKQGERGTEFFIIWEGSAEVRKKRADGTEDAVGTLSRGDYFGELALLNNAPRAASIVASQPSAGASSTNPAPRLRVATLSEQAFTRLLGPLAGIMSRHAETHYGSAGDPLMMSGGAGASSSGARAGGASGGGGGGGASSGASASGGGGYPFGSTYVLGSTPANSMHHPMGGGRTAADPLAPHEARGAPPAGGPFAMDLAAPDQGGGMWLGASPFGTSPFAAQGGGGSGGPPSGGAAGGGLSGYTFGQAV
ncbi:hypothetical protein CF319_g4671 [Tilletia indica]|nr:hypothetical protein CF319_g4671 [Tilletia indica]